MWGVWREEKGRTEEELVGFVADDGEGADEDQYSAHHGQVSATQFGGLDYEERNFRTATTP